MQQKLNTFKTLSFGVLLLLVIPLTCLSQSEHPVTGRPIANVMSVSGADWLERSEREIEELPETALEKIGIRRGQTVADVGAGSGYFTVRLARRVGVEGKVYAVDVQPEMLAIIRKRIAKENLTNVEPFLAQRWIRGFPKTHWT